MVKRPIASDLQGFLDLTGINKNLMSDFTTLENIGHILT